MGYIVFWTSLGFITPLQYHPEVCYVTGLLVQDPYVIVIREDHC